MNAFTKTIAPCVFGILAAHQNTKAADLRWLSSVAGAVVVGTVEVRTETATSVSFTLAVQRVLKGAKLLATGSAVVTHLCSAKGIRTKSTDVIQVQVTGIWFLTRAGSGWDVIPTREHGLFVTLFLPASATGPRQYAYEPSAATVDKVVYEMGDGLWTNGADPLFKVLLLAYASTPTTDKVLSDLLQSANPSLRAGALAGLLTNSTPGSLQAFSQMWPIVRGHVGESFIVSALRSDFRDTSPESVSQLIVVAQNAAGSPKLREAAVRALRSIRTKETLLFFASLLSGTDEREQMDAVVAISSFANGCPPQTPANVGSMDYMQFKNPSIFGNQSTMENFAIGTDAEHQKRPALVAFWTDWWAKNHAALSAQ